MQAIVADGARATGPRAAMTYPPAAWVRHLVSAEE